MFEISAHAAQRWVERVQPGISVEDARAAIRQHTRVIEIALSMGCPSVVLGSGVRLALDGGRVVTVYPRQPKIGSKQRRRKIPFSMFRKRERDDAD